MNAADVQAKANELVAVLDGMDRNRGLGELEHGTIQHLLRLLAKAYLARKRADVERTGESAITPFGDDRTVTATEVAVLCADMLNAVDMDTFELNMWRSLGQF